MSGVDGVMEPIPQEWVKQYVDSLLSVAAKLSEGGFRDAILLRADHAMDLVKAFRERDKPWETVSLTENLVAT